jgi:hypothetical protein
MNEFIRMQEWDGVDLSDATVTRMIADSAEAVMKPHRRSKVSYSISGNRLILVTYHGDYLEVYSAVIEKHGTIVDRVAEEWIPLYAEEVGGAEDMDEWTDRPF